MDYSSRRLSFQDSKLSPATWALVQNLYGRPKGHSIDLMARVSNVQTDLFAQSPVFTGLMLFLILTFCRPFALFLILLNILIA